MENTTLPPSLQHDQFPPISIGLAQILSQIERSPEFRLIRIEQEHRRELAAVKAELHKKQTIIDGFSKMVLTSVQQRRL